VSKEKLKSLRNKIDSVDEKLLQLIQRRGSLAKKVGDLKKITTPKGLFYKPAREAEILRKIIKLNDGSVMPDNKVRQIFKELISACLSLEGDMKVSYLGPAGTHSEAAALMHFGSSAIFDPRSSIEDVFQQVEVGESSLGLVPVENSSEGVVNTTLNCLADSTLSICGEIYLPIHHHLASSKKINLVDAKIIASHPQALGQCGKWIDAHLPGIKRKATSSSAEAAQFAKDNPATLCVVSSVAIDQYKLYEHRKNIEDFKDNTTRFLVIGSLKIEATAKDKSSFLVQTANKPGALVELLQPFQQRNINLNRIETRPSRQSTGSHNFFIDIEGHQNNSQVKQAISDLKATGASVRSLGSYPTES